MTTNYKSKVSDFMHWFGLLTALGFLGLGLFTVFTHYLDSNQNIRFILSFFLFSFGFFRGVNWYIKHKARKYSEDTDYQDI